MILRTLKKELRHLYFSNALGAVLPLHILLNCNHFSDCKRTLRHSDALHEKYIKRIPRLARQFSSFSILGDSQASQPTESNEEEETMAIENGSDESEQMQTSFKHPSEVFV